MNRTITLAVAAAFVAVAAIMLPHAAQEAIGQDHDQPSRPGMMGGMKHGMMGGMEGMKMSEPMKLRCRMMMKMEVAPHDPAALLAMKDQLKLSEEQTKRLQAILAQARHQAEEVVTDQQKASLQPLEKLPKTMMEMHHQMMEKMGSAKGGMKMQMMCPMMEMMERMRHEPPAAESGVTEHGRNQ